MSIQTRVKKILFSTVAIVLCASLCACSGKSTAGESVAESSGYATALSFDLKPAQDSTRVLENPDKGWYLHYYDNGITKYCDGLMPEDILDDFPLLDHIYLRLAWSFLEPKEGQYDWNVIDKVIDPWVAAGVKISFRITCKETNNDIYYATPKWVRDAGAKGTDLNNAWEPDYGDAVFLEKLENFHKAFAARYASRPETVYVDIGSYGDWGEGHTVFGTKKDWPWETIKKHLDIYTKYYEDTQLVISDDFIDSRGTSEGKNEILSYVLSHGITFRDDSVSVKWFADHYGYSTLRSTHLFDQTWTKLPSVLELEHYGTAVQEGTWQKGGPFLAAAKEAHCTYAGFHGYPKQWLKENGDLAKKMGNQLGYWYFLDSLDVTSAIQSGAFTVKCKWRNDGFSVAYNRYKLQFKLTAEDGSEKICDVDSFDNTGWQPSSTASASYNLSFDGAASGVHTLSVRMYNSSGRTIELGFDESRRDSSGFYAIGNIKI